VQVQVHASNRWTNVIRESTKINVIRHIKAACRGMAYWSAARKEKLAEGKPTPTIGVIPL